MLLNGVFRDPRTGKRFRVVLEHISDLMLIDVDSEKAWPFPISEQDFISLGYESIPDPYPIPSVREASVGDQSRVEAMDARRPLLDQ